MKKSTFNHFAATIAFAACAILTTACSSADEPADNTRHEIELSPASRSAANELRNFYPKFTMDAIKAADLRSDNGSGNVIVSPLSASMLIAMAANGVEEDAAAQLASYLGVSDLNSLNALAQSLLAALPDADRKTTLSIGNSIWVSKEYSLKPAFASVMKTSFKAHIDGMDFSKTDALETINNWIASATGKRHEAFLGHDAVNPLTIALLINTLSFKSEWADQLFDPDLTLRDTFRGFKGETQVDMMSGAAVYPYVETDAYQACSIVFGNKAFSIMLVMPSQEIYDKDRFPSISPDVIAALKDKMAEEFFSLRLPKFKAASKTDLNNVLEAAGIGGLNKEVRFTMFDQPVREAIEMRQDASLSIDEKGAKMDAVSVGEIVATAPPVKGVLEFNRPFYFFITEESTGACLLSGRIADL